MGDLVELGAVVAEQLVPLGFSFMRAEISEVKTCLREQADSTDRFLRVHICCMAVACDIA